MNLLDDLNPAQRQAVEQTEGTVLVLAGAGSGKTRVLTYRIAHLIRDCDVRPWHILAVTFTNKASGEMRERIEHLVGPESEDAWIGTFHSVCARILRYESAAFDLGANFTIYDEDDRRAVVRRVLAELGVSDQDLDARGALSQISRAKNSMIDHRLFAQRAGDSRQRRLVADVYESYEAELRSNNALDFDDLIVEPVRQFRRNPDILDKYRDRFQYLLIDEYQDTNRPQYLLAKRLAQEHRNICCVGDDDQAIYRFRGADIRNILDFESDYPEARIVRLEQNYRSTGRILAVANAVIENNPGRKGKNLWTDAGEGDPIELAECADDRAEARHVVSTVSAFCARKGMSPREAAVLYRTNAQSRALEEELQRAGMPYIIVGGTRFYERREIKDLIAYLRLLANPDDDVSLLRVINVPKRGLGDTTVGRLRTFAAERSLSLTEALAFTEEIPDLGSRAVANLMEFAELLAALKQLAAAEPGDLAELAEQLLERTGYLEALEGEIPSPETMARIENVGQLVARMAEFAHSADDDGNALASFLEEVALMTPADDADGDDRDALTLMTLHMAKGLEFPLVLITGLEENLFPTSRALEESQHSPEGIEEERRLFYVGITRARRHLVLTWSRWRYVFGSLQESMPSRFLDEVPRDLVETLEVAEPTDLGMLAASRRQNARARRARNFPPPERAVRKPVQPPPQGVHYEWDEAEAAHCGDGNGELGDGDDPLAVGRWVLHPNWGRGRIVDRQGSGDDLKLSISFAQGRTKKVLAAFAQLQPG